MILDGTRLGVRSFRPCQGSGSPNSVLDAAHARAAARGAQDWSEADRLRAEIEAAGWKIVDRGTDFALEPAQPPTVEEGGVVRYGASADVPSRLGEPAVGLATVVLVATDWPADVARAVASTRRSHPLDDDRSSWSPTDRRLPRTTLVPPSRTMRSRSSGRAQRLGTGAAWNIGIRRATGPIVIILDAISRADRRHRHAARPSRSTTRGRRRRRLRDRRAPTCGAFDEAPAGDVDRDRGLRDGVPARRRRSPAARIDERFRFYRNLDIWWSLVLRDEGEEKARRAAPSPFRSRRPATSTAAGPRFRRRSATG